MLKKYLWPFALAILLNAIVLGIIFHSQIAAHFADDQPTPAIKVNLNQLVKNLNKAHAQSNLTSAAWINKHYGKAVTIKQHFTAGKNLQGYVVSLKANPASHSIIYSVNNGDYFFIGTVIDKHGKNVSQANAQRYINSPLNKTIFQQAQHLSDIMQGKKNVPQVTIIIDPNSNLFPEQWSELAYDISQGAFAVKWVLVNYLKPMGPNVANDILQAKNPLAAMAYNAEHYNKQSQTGGYVKNLPLTQSIKKQLMANWSFVQKYDLYKLPVSILSSNKHFYVIQGAVMDETLETIVADSPNKAGK